MVGGSRDQARSVRSSNVCDGRVDLKAGLGRTVTQLHSFSGDRHFDNLTEMFHLNFRFISFSLILFVPIAFSADHSFLDDLFGRSRHSKVVVPKEARSLLPCERYDKKEDFSPGKYCIGLYSYFILECPGNKINGCPGGQRCQEDLTKPGSGKCIPSRDIQDQLAFANPRPCQLRNSYNGKFCIGRDGKWLLTCPGEKVEKCPSVCKTVLPQDGKASCEMKVRND